MQGILAGKRHMSRKECSLSPTPWVEVLASVYTVLIIHHFSCAYTHVWQMVMASKSNFCSVLKKKNILVFSARATCPATIHDSAVIAARAPICRNGPVAWTERADSREDKDKTERERERREKILKNRDKREMM